MRKVLSGFAAAAALTLALGGASAQAATVLDVNWNPDCSKSTCFNEQGVFKQSFTSGSFNGPVTIGQLLLDRGILGSLDGATFRLSFQLNGEELGTWGKFNMAGIGGDELWFGGETFTWNPEDGDLVLVLEVVPPPKAGMGGFFFAAASSEGGPGGGGQGPTGGDETPQNGPGEQGDAGRPTTAVPEPGAWALMIGGFGLAGAMFRRRRAVLPVQP